MEKIRSIEQLRLKKELLQLQQMIAELRMRNEIHTIRRRGLRKSLFSSLPGLITAGLKSTVGKQILFSAGSSLAKKIFKRRSQRSRV